VERSALDPAPIFVYMMYTKGFHSSNGSPFSKPRVACQNRRGFVLLKLNTSA
jgi:hypothetical protein